MTWENRITFEVSSADPDSDWPVWVDFTQRVRDVVQAIEVNTGRQNDLDGVEPTSFTLVLDNSDDALTYGNTLSPYASWWGPGRKCRLRDTIGSNVFDIATGYLQTPTEGLVTQGIEHRVQLSVVDRIGRLGSAEPFISTLGAHILGSPGATGLVAYWPLVGSLDGHPAGPIAQAPVQRSALALSAGQEPTSSAVEVIQFGAGQPPPGEDLAPVLWAPADAFDVNAYRLRCTLSTPITLSAGQFLTLVCWFNSSPDAVVGSSGGEHYVLLEGNSPFDGASLFRDDTSTGGEYKGAIISGGTWGTNFEGSFVGPGVWHIFAGHYQLAALQEMWFDNATVSTSFGGSPPASITFTTMTIGSGGINGSIAHVQVYVDSGAFSRSEFLAQRNVGLYGFERQTTGERVRTIASYAGVRGGEMNIDTGTSVMQKASLAGVTPLEAMRDAERTEQGLLYVDGSGILQFRDRRSLYNI